MLNPSSSADENEEVSGLLDTTGNLNQKDEESASEGIPLCGILSVKFYKPYFDVDTQDVTARLFHALTMFKDGSFMALIADRPDAYGPFWVKL